MLPIYHVTSNIGTSMRCGINHIVLPYGTPVVTLADLQPVLAHAKESARVLQGYVSLRMHHTAMATDPDYLLAQRLLDELKGLVP